jgi:hypothetical protein
MLTSKGRTAWTSPGGLSMLDLAYLALGAGTLIALALYAAALGKL